MHRIDALSCTRMGIETFSATARAPGIWKVYAPPLHVRFPGMKGSLWCARGHTVKGLYPKLLATPTSIATTHALGSLASNARRDSRRPEEPLLYAERERLGVEFEEPDALRVRAPERAERGKARIDARILPPELEVAGGQHIAIAARTDDLSAL